MALTVISKNRVVEINGGTGFITKDTWAVARMRWVSKTASANDTCVVSAGDGNVVWESNATGADWSEETDFSKEPPIAGISVTTLTSGNLYIYLR